MPKGLIFLSLRQSCICRNKSPVGASGCAGADKEQGEAATSCLHEDKIRPESDEEGEALFRETKELYIFGKKSCNG